LRAFLFSAAERPPYGGRGAAEKPSPDAKRPDGAKLKKGVETYVSAPGVFTFFPSKKSASIRGGFLGFLFAKNGEAPRNVAG
jgi:hypothetical protein